MNTLRDDIKKFFDIEIPISGGLGSSIDDPIVLELDNEEDGVRMEYIVLRYIHSLLNTSYKIDSQKLIKNNGKFIDKFECIWNNDQENFHCYYFDVSRFFGISKESN